MVTSILEEILSLAKFEQLIQRLGTLASLSKSHSLKLENDSKECKESADIMDTQHKG